MRHSRSYPGCDLSCSIRYLTNALSVHRKTKRTNTKNWWPSLAASDIASKASKRANWRKLHFQNCYRKRAWTIPNHHYGTHPDSVARRNYPLLHLCGVKKTQSGDECHSWKPQIFPNWNGSYHSIKFLIVKGNGGTSEIHCAPLPPSAGRAGVGSAGQRSATGVSGTHSRADRLSVEDMRKAEFSQMLIDSKKDF